MKIALVSRETPLSKRCGGIGHYIWDLAHDLKNEGHDVIIIGASDDLKEKIVYSIKGVKVILLPDVDYYVSNNKFLSYVFSKLRKIFFYRKYRKILSNYLKDLVYKQEIEIVEFPEYGNEALFWLKENRKIPTIIRLHGPAILDRKTQKKVSLILHPIKYFYGILEIQTLKKADAITSASKELSKFFEINFGIKNIHTIYNSINYEEWYLPIKSSYLSNEIKIFSAGSITEGKGYWELFEACRQLNEEGYKISLTVAGKIGKLGKYLINISQKKNYKWFKILGPVDRSRLKYFYNEAHISCFPSWWEPFGLVCLEAMAAGSIVIGSNKGGMSEIIDDNIDGFLVTPKNVDELKSKIKYIIELPEDIKFLIRKNAQEKVRKFFDSKVIIKKHINFYKSLLQKWEKGNIQKL